MNTRPELSTVLVNGMLPGHRFGEVSRCTGETRQFRVQVRIWPGRPLTATRLCAIVFHEHKVDFLPHNLVWEVLP